MFNDDNHDISSNTWARSIEPINKAGYMDGSSDGQKASFQSSFDTGYNQGFNFGFQLGFSDALRSLPEQQSVRDTGLRDARRINCQICLNVTTQDKVDNLYNIQEERNIECLKTSIKTT